MRPAARRRGALEGWTEHGLAAVVDVALVAQTSAAAESVGLGGVYIGGIRNDPQTVVDQLQSPIWWCAVRALPRLAREIPRVQAPQALILICTRMSTGTQTLSAWRTTTGPWPIYAARGNNARRSDWSATTAKATQGKKREHMLPWLRRMGFFKC